MIVVLIVICTVFVMTIYSCLVVASRTDRNMERLMEEEKRKNE